jgi:hypothetical protein
MLPNVPDELDWVIVRKDCTLASVFEKVVGGIKKDLEQINSSTQSNKFQISRNGAYVSVYEERDGRAGRNVAITCTENCIRAECGETKLEATLMVNDEGKCCLKVDGKERKVWQFRKDALESLFFGDGWFR